MKTILVATDFSPAANNAADYAADMAMEINAGILLFHVYQTPVMYPDAAMPANEADLQQAAENKINLLKKILALRTKGEVLIETEVRWGAFFTELESIAEKIIPYVVVMGSQGTSATERLFFGGHTVYAMQHLKWPVITLPEKAVFSRVKKMGLACDFDKATCTMPVSQLKTFVGDFESALYIINSGNQQAFDPGIIFEAESLSERFSPLVPNCNFITGKHPDEGIIDFAEKNNIDMLVVLPKDHGLLQKLFHSSHTKQLVLHSQIPVMAIHTS